MKRLQSTTRSPVYNHFGETVAGASVIRAYGATERFIETSDAKIDLNQKFSYASITANRFVALGYCFEVLVTKLSKHKCFDY